MKATSRSSPSLSLSGSHHPFCFSATMGKHGKFKKPENLGKGKVTPVQIAFIVDRYLADNNCTNTLSAFRAEASDLLSKIKGKEAPKGLMGLGEILDEYISLKEQRVMVDQEKRRVEMALGGIQDVMRVYYSVGGIPLPSSPPLLPPQFLGTPTATVFPASNPNYGSPPDHIIRGAPVTSGAQSPMLPLKVGEPNNSTPAPMSSSAQKRKSSESAPRVPSAPKKSRPQLSKESSMIQRTQLSQATFINNMKENVEKFSSVSSASIDHQTIKSLAQGSSVAKSLFMQPSEPRTDSSSPKTPQAFPSQIDKPITSPCNSSIHTNNGNTSQGIASANCSIVSSKTIIVSPLKHSGYYAVQRSYHVTSPMKSNTKNLSKRDHVKGRLDFDESDVASDTEKEVAAECSTSSTDGETKESFDFDLPDLDLFNGDISFSELLVDLDLVCDGIPSQSASDPADVNPGLEHQVGSGRSEMIQALADSCLPAVTEVLSEKDMNIQGLDSVTSLKTITKCIVVSPAKIRRNLILEQTNSPAKV